jgi:hypothetical protein
MVSSASGPHSSTATYQATLDPGNSQSVSGGPGSGAEYFSKSAGHGATGAVDEQPQEEN